MKKNAFTLIETLIAITIVTIAVVGPFVTASRALIAAYTARDQLTASYLAQEGVEYVRLMRDSVYLSDYQTEPSDPTISNDAFSTFISGSQPGSITTCMGLGDGTTNCALADPLATMGTGSGKSLTLCGTGGCPPLYLNAGRYTTTTSGTATSFVRSIKFYGGNNGDLGSEIEVVVTVSWTDHSVPYSTSVTDYLSPWE